MVLKTAATACSLYSVIITGAVVLCLLASVSAKALDYSTYGYEQLHCPQILTFSGKKFSFYQSLKNQMGFGDLSNFLIKKGKIQLVYDELIAGNYAFLQGSVEKINAMGRVSRMKCNYIGGGKELAIKVIFSSGFTYRLSNSVFGGEGVDHCFGYDDSAASAHMFCSVRPFYTLFVNQIHGKYGLGADLNILFSDGTSYTVKAGEIGAVPRKGLAQLFVKYQDDKHEVTAGCGGGVTGYVHFHPADASVYQLSGHRLYNHFERFECRVNENTVTPLSFAKEWDFQQCNSFGCYGDWRDDEYEDAQDDQQQKTFYSQGSREEQKKSHYSQGSRQKQQYSGNYQYQGNSPRKNPDVYYESWLNFRIVDLWFWYVTGASDNKIGQAFFDLNMWPVKDLHAIKRAYRAMAKKVHPDKEGGSQQQFEKLQKDYELLETSIQNAMPKGP